MHTLIAHIRAQPDARAIELNYDVDNSVAARLYARLGFEPTGEVDEGEIRARLVLGVRER
jgi:diamine N-acetyltransferase